MTRSQLAGCGQFRAPTVVEDSQSVLLPRHSHADASYVDAPLHVGVDLWGIAWP